MTLCNFGHPSCHQVPLIRSQPSDQIRRTQGPSWWTQWALLFPDPCPVGLWLRVALGQVLGGHTGWGTHQVVKIHFSPFLGHGEIHMVMSVLRGGVMLRAGGRQSFLWLKSMPGCSGVPNESSQQLWESCVHFPSSHQRQKPAEFM